MRGTSLDQIIELAVLDTSDERGDLGGGVDQRRTTGITRITDGDRPVRQVGDLHATPVWIAVAALAPANSSQPGSWHAVIGLRHDLLTLSSPVGVSELQPGARCRCQNVTACTCICSVQSDILADVLTTVLATARSAHQDGLARHDSPTCGDGDGRNLAPARMASGTAAGW